MPIPTDAIVVTGGAGFVGSHLVEALTADPANYVVSLDDYSTGLEINHMSSSNVTYLNGQTQDIATLIDKRPSVIFHLGEYARVERSRVEPERVWKSLMGTIQVLEYCRLFKVPVPIVYAASSTRFSADGQGTHLSPYTFAKAMSVELVQRYANWYRVPNAIAYLFNVYGPREISTGDHATVIGKFIRQYLADEPLVVTAPGTQLRNFTNVKDVVDGFLRLRNNTDGREYQLGHGKKHSVLDVAQMFPGATIQMRPEVPGNRSDASIDTTTAESIGWHARYELMDYIREAIRSKRDTD
jgi:UDP-glucose 4-epimerase